MWKILLPLMLTCITHVYVKGSLEEKPGDKYYEEAVQQAKAEVSEAYDDLWRKLTDRTVRQSPERQLLATKHPSKKARKHAKGKETIERAFEIIKQLLKEREGKTSESLHDLVSSTKQQEIEVEAACEKQVPNCSDYEYNRKYRTFDGTCNNIENPLWGASVTPFPRLIEAFYEDGVSLPRGWSAEHTYFGCALPSARKVSSHAVSSHDVESDVLYSLMLMQWGQFVDHDIDLTPLDPFGKSFSSGIPCEENCKNEMPCFPIPVPYDDKRITTVDCIGFVRSAAACGVGTREQINEITSFIDASNIYGSTDESVERLRDHEDRSFLRGSEKSPAGKSYLPYDEDDVFAACEKDLSRNETKCYMSGDIRANEQLALTTMHTLWMREHNRIAKTLKIINPHWDEETVFQESRKIVGATMQHITYYHWLPKILGQKGMEIIGDYVKYDPEVDPSIVNEFATACYRFGHALIQPVIQRLNEYWEETEFGHLSLHEAFFSPYRLTEEGGIDPIMRGLLHLGAKEMNPEKICTTEVTEKLFALARKIALDLASLNIQRGRDHGLPTYSQVTEFCGLEKDDLRLNKNTFEKLLEVYGRWENIDLWVGGLAEHPEIDARVGPTIRCVLANQFKRLRDGDRFYYENNDVFTADQLKEIRKASLSRVICDNSDSIKTVQKDAFVIPYEYDDYKSCSDTESIPYVDLWVWKEEVVSEYEEEHCD